MSHPVITVENISKQYMIGRQERNTTLVASLLRSLSAPMRRTAGLLRGNLTSAADLDEEFWALRDIGFDVHQGEVVGIVGRNGAGKSTLLKLLSRIAYPTTGRITVEGRVGSLLEVGTGFHPELTGRENVFFNGALLGMGRQEITRKFDEIVAFAGVERFIYTPIKHYSSGMQVRLAFAVAAHLEPEILIIDEVLTVGDAEFQRKCLAKMNEVAHEGRTVLFVSHNMSAVQTLCTRGILLEHGRMIESGDTSTIVNSYMSRNRVEQSMDLSDSRRVKGGDRLRLTDAWFENADGDSSTHATTGEQLHVCMAYINRGLPAGTAVSAGITIQSGLEQPIFSFFSHYLGQYFENLPERGVLRCSIPELPLSPGNYLVGCRLQDRRKDILDEPHARIPIQVIGSDYYGSGTTDIQHEGPVVVRGIWNAEPFHPAEVTGRNIEVGAADVAV